MLLFDEKGKPEYSTSLGRVGNRFNEHPMLNPRIESLDLCANPALPIIVTANKYGLLTKREVKMTGYWPSSFFACLWTETKSRSINTQKKNEANIQSS